MSNNEFHQDDDEFRKILSDEQKQKDRRDLVNQFALVPMALCLDLQDKRISYRDVCIYLYLLAKKNLEQESWWGLNHLSAMTGIHERSLKESLAALKKCGHIKRRHRMGKSSITVCQTYVVRDETQTRIFNKGKEVARHERRAHQQLQTVKGTGFRPSLVAPGLSASRN